MTTQLDDTICAIATPIGEGGIGIVRVSGPEALRLASKIVSLRRGGNLEEMKSHQLYLAAVTLSAEGAEGRVLSQQGTKQIDEALAVLMRAPHSYTGEDVLEIHCHGGGIILATVCDLLVRSGARMAEPGEFTRRAFLHGRLDLTQAEAVLDTIRATTTTSLLMAQEQLKGSLSTKVEQMRKEFIHILAHLEAGLDFVGHTDLLRKHFNQEAIMMLGTQKMFVALFTEHIPLKEVAQSIKYKKLKQFFFYNISIIKKYKDTLPYEDEYLVSGNFI